MAKKGNQWISVAFPNRNRQNLRRVEKDGGRIKGYPTWLLCDTWEGRIQCLGLVWKKLMSRVESEVYIVNSCGTGIEELGSRNSDLERHRLILCSMKLSYNTSESFLKNGD